MMLSQPSRGNQNKAKQRGSDPRGVGGTQHPPARGVQSFAEEKVRADCRHTRKRNILEKRYFLG